MKMLNFTAHPVGKKQNNKKFPCQNCWGSKTFKTRYHKTLPPSILKAYKQLPLSTKIMYFQQLQIISLDSLGSKRGV